MPRIASILRRFTRASARRRVVAAVALRPCAGGELEFLLVRTSDGERWTFPKGGCDRGETQAEAAAREAIEEAGAAGRIASEPIAEYRYGDDVVAAFVLEVERDDLPAEPGRDPVWLGFDAARSRLAEGRERTFGAEIERVLLAAQRAVAVK
ncbi:MAG: NUDIX domain-containing protein [Actinomycetota bacterium]|nr:NUDIX domain-containing protein [Actinomycetota bacterium]